MSEQKRFIPFTPAGTALCHLASASREEAWGKLLVDAAHMPYKTQANFEKRGYKVEEMDSEVKEISIEFEGPASKLRLTHDDFDLLESMCVGAVIEAREDLEECIEKNPMLEIIQEATAFQQHTELLLTKILCMRAAFTAYMADNEEADDATPTTH